VALGGQDVHALTERGTGFLAARPSAGTPVYCEDCGKQQSMIAENTNIDPLCGTCRSIIAVASRPE